MKHQGSKGRCTDLCDITEIMLKLAKQVINSFTTEYINHAFSLAKNTLPSQDEETV